jgi:hypothetical protein
MKLQARLAARGKSTAGPVPGAWGLRAIYCTITAGCSMGEEANAVSNIGTYMDRMEELEKMLANIR